MICFWLTIGFGSVYGLVQGFNTARQIIIEETQRLK